jgi:hypothetical protein
LKLIEQRSIPPNLQRPRPRPPLVQMTPIGTPTDRLTKPSLPPRQILRLLFPFLLVQPRRLLRWYYAPHPGIHRNRERRRNLFSYFSPCFCRLPERAQALLEFLGRMSVPDVYFFDLALFGEGREDDTFEVPIYASRMYLGVRYE